MEKEKFSQPMRNKIVENSRIVVGGLLGLIFAILILALGLSQTVFIVFLTLIGGLLGSRDSLLGDFRDLVERLFPGDLS